MKPFLLRPCGLPDVWRRPEAQYVRLCDSFGAELAEDVAAESDVPPYDEALRDGWAVSSGDAARGIAPGAVENGSTAPALAPGTALWVNTGGMLPAGADAVIPAASPAETARAGLACEAGRHVMRQGAEWRSGELLISRGTQIGAAETALLLETGIERVKVCAAPEVGLLSTGSELKDLHCRGVGGPVRVSSNSAYLRALLLSVGVRHVHAAAAADEESEIARRLVELAHRSNFILTIGGTGGGLRDLTRRAVISAGGRLHEGEACAGGVPPFIMGEVAGVPLFGLPGNPLGAMMIAQRVVLPLVWSRFHASPLRPETVEAVFAGDAVEAATGELCVRLEHNADGWRAFAVEKGTGASRLFREAGGVVRLENAGIRRGDRVRVERFVN